MFTTGQSHPGQLAEFRRSQDLSNQSSQYHTYFGMDGSLEMPTDFPNDLVFDEIVTSDSAWFIETLEEFTGSLDDEIDRSSGMADLVFLKRKRISSEEETILQPSLFSLCDNVVENMFEFLSYRDRASFSSTCKSLHTQWFQSLGSRFTICCNGCQACNLGLAGQCSGTRHSFTGAHVSWVIRSSYRRLKELVLCGSEMGNDDLAFAWPLLKSLQTLDLSNCSKLSDRTVELLANNCTELRVVRLKELAVTDASVSVLMEKLTKLETLDLWGCHRVTDKSVQKLVERAESIKELNLWGCHNISDVSISKIAVSCRKLTSLNLRYCHRITDRSIAAVASNLISLEHLNLRYCFKITDASLLLIASHMHGLRSLNLSQCRRPTDASIMAVARQCTELEQLRLWGCQLTAASVQAVCTHLPGLRLLDIRSQQSGCVIGGQAMVDTMLGGGGENYRDRLLRWQQSTDGVFVKDQ